MAYRTSNQAWSKGLDPCTTITSNSRTSNCQCSLFSKKNQIIRIFSISGWLAVPINLNKWSSNVSYILFCSHYLLVGGLSLIHHIKMKTGRLNIFYFLAWLAKALRYKPEAAVSIPDGVTGIFKWHNPSGRTMALGSTQPLTEMRTRKISWRVKAPGTQGWQPYHIHVPIVRKSASLTLMETYGSVILIDIFVNCNWVVTRWQ